MTWLPMLVVVCSALQPFQVYAGSSYGACPFSDVEIVYVLADGANATLEKHGPSRVLANRGCSRG